MINQDVDLVAQDFVEKNGLTSYWKTSSLFGSNVKNIFDEAIKCTYEFRLLKKQQIDESVEESNTSKVRQAKATKSGILADEWFDK